MNTYGHPKPGSSEYEQIELSEKRQEQQEAEDRQYEMTRCLDCMGSKKANVGRWARRSSKQRSCPTCLGLGKVRRRK